MANIRINFMILAYVILKIVSAETNTPLSPIITLKDGSRLRGLETKAETDKPVTEFLGIPYAEPPLKDLRFRPPVAKRPWTQIYEAIERPNSCMQTPDTFFRHFSGAEMWNANTNKSEDCLYLNVWVPGRVDPNKRLAVMIWIYGGGFWSGTSTLDVYDGKILSSEEQVIIVSMNYRVSVFGFLYFGRGSKAPGNAGLFDQLEAMKWVHENIHHFGGDPGKVTLFGESAGAALIGMHLLSPLSQSYFKRAILQSGSPVAPWATTPPDALIERSLLFGEACHCKNSTIRSNQTAGNDLDKIIECLQNADAQRLLDKEWMTHDFIDFPWTPVVDDYFLIEEPRISLENGRLLKRTELLLGSNFDESIYFAIYFLSTIFPKEYIFKKSEFLVTDKLFEKSVKLLLPSKFRKNPLITEAILFEYRNWQPSGGAYQRQQALDKLFGDYHFTCPLIDFAKSYETNGSVYFYYFTYRSSQQAWPAWMGAIMGYEIHFVFGQPLNTKDYRYTEEEKDLSRRIMRYWANFARTGNPNNSSDGGTAGTTETWPAYTNDQRYLTLTTNISEIGNGPRQRQCHFWKQYLPMIINATQTTTTCSQ